MGLQLLEGGGPAGGRGGDDDGRHLLPEPGVGDPDDDGVGDAGVGPDDGLHFFGIDLLAAGVDGLGAPAEEPDAAVGVDDRHVARQGPAATVDLDEGAGAFRGVVVVAEGRAAGRREPSDLSGAGGDRREVVVDDDGGVPRREVQRLAGRVGGADEGDRLDRRLGGPDGLHHGQDRGERGEEAVLDVGGQETAARAEEPQRRGVEPAGGGAELVEERPAAGVTDEVQHHDPFPGHDLEDPSHVHVPVRVQHNAAAAEQGAERRPLAAGVGQGSERQRDELVRSRVSGGQKRRQALRAVGHRGGPDLLGSLDRGSPGVPAAERGEEDVFVAPDDALWASGGAAGIEDVVVIGGPGRDVTSRGRPGDDRLIGRPDGQVGAQRRDPGGDGVGVGGELGVGDERDGVGVGAHVGDLVGDIPVVDVDRDRPHLEAGQHRLQVLDVGVEVAGHVVPGADAERLQPVRQAVGAGVEVTVGEVAIPAADGDAVRDVVDDALEQVSEVELHRPGRRYRQDRGSGTWTRRRHPQGAVHLAGLPGPRARTALAPGLAGGVPRRAGGRGRRLVRVHDR